MYYTLCVENSALSYRGQNLGKPEGEKSKSLILHLKGGRMPKYKNARITDHMHALAPV
jgi:hypothetical protein